MEKIQFKTNYVQDRKKLTSERAMIIKEFLDRLNQERGPQYPEIKPGRLGMMLSHMTNQHLYQFLADCRYARHFSRYFWWAINPKNHK